MQKRKLLATAHNEGEIMNIEEFLLPIPESENAEEKYGKCGKFLKYEQEYDDIKEFRREDDPRLNQGVWQTTPKKAQWLDVKKKCGSLLRTRTKDLQIAMWLLEALIALDGFSGLNDGITLINALCEKFWDEIHPQINNGNYAARMSPFYFLTEKVLDRILLIPLTAPTDGMSAIFTLSDWISSQYNMRVKVKGSINPKDLQKSVLSTPIDFIDSIKTKLETIIPNVRKLDALISEHCPNDAPSFRAVYEMLDDVQRTNTKNLESKKKQMAEIPKPQEQHKLSESEESNDNVENNNEENEKPTVEQAYMLIENIASFLEKEQPQSPSSILLKIAAAIGKKTFQQLMETNMQNGTNVVGTISELYKVLK